jgi:hypothetical protein
MNPTADKIREHLEDHNGFYIAPNHTEIMFEQVQGRTEVSVTLPVNAGEDRKINIDLVVRFKSIEEFVERAGINDVSDLHRIKNSVCWAQYALGNGYVSCCVDWLNLACISFRKTEAHFTHWEERLPGIAMTMVYSMDLKYYDEVHDALTLSEQFIGYIESKREELIRRKPPKGGFIELKRQ